MSKPAMPIDADLKRLLQSAGLISEPLTAAEAMLDFTSACLSGVAAWEKATGWYPFLAGATSVRTFDSANVEFLPDAYPFLDLQGGILSLTSLKYGVDPENPTTTGTAMTVNRDFYLAPKNAAAKGKPYTYIEFQTYPYGGIPRGGARSIRVDAVWGYGTTVPDDAWQAVLRLAALELLPQIVAVLTGGVKSWSEIDVKEDYGDNPHSALKSAFETQCIRTASRYRRLNI